MNNYYEQIRKACIAVNPSIVIDEIYHYRGPDSPPDIEVVTRDLHLEDILMVLPEDIMMNARNGETFQIDNGGGFHLIFTYDLSKSVENQPPETLKFICDNIK